MDEREVVVVTGASSGFGNLTARALARAGYTVYAGMRASTGRNAAQVAELAELAAVEWVDVHGVEMDVTDQDSVDAALPHLRSHGGLLVWVASTSTRGGHPPFLAPYFAAPAPTTSPTPTRGPSTTTKPTASCTAPSTRTWPVSSPRATTRPKSPPRLPG